MALIAACSGLVPTGSSTTTLPLPSLSPRSPTPSSTPTATASVPPYLPWTRVADQAALRGIELKAVIAFGPGLVAAGCTIITIQVPEDTGGCGAGPVVLTSVDGSAWSSIAGFPGSSADTIDALALGGDGIVAVGTGVWTSANGTSWRRVLDLLPPPVVAHVVNASWSDTAACPDPCPTPGPPFHAEMSAVTATASGLVAVGSIGSATGGAFRAVWTSADGIRWGGPNLKTFSVPRKDVLPPFYAIANGGPGLVAVAQGDQTLWVSTDAKQAAFRPEVR